MAIFKRTKKEAAPAKKEKKASGTSSTRTVSADTSILFAPRITEKAAIITEAGVYAFNVVPSATKPQIAAAVKKLFGVTPRKIRVVTIRKTRVTTRATGKAGHTRGGKKAYVYLAKGDKIDLA